MNIDALIAKKMEERQAAGLRLRLHFADREPFNYYPASTEKRDQVITNLRSRIGTEYQGHILTDVEIVE